jgi:type IV pilus assembly protein PilB
MGKKRLGDVLRERGHISNEDLSDALQEQQQKVIFLGEALLQRGSVRKEDLIAALEDVTQVPYIDCSSARIDPELLKLVPPAVALRHSALPLAREGEAVVMVMAEPQNLVAIDELRFVCGKPILPRLGFRSEIVAAIEKHYERPPTGPVAQKKAPAKAAAAEPERHRLEFFSASSRHSSKEAIKEIQKEMRSQPTSAVRLVSDAIAAAVEKEASDIHIEPHAEGAAVRLRVDGVLREHSQIPRELQTSVLSRIKILADLDIAERRTPQDGRFLVQVGHRKIDLRVSTLPTHYGEKVVMRLLDPSAPRLQFADLGMALEMCQELSRVLEMPQGMLLVTGPTGSGKTTTLYAALHQVRSPSVNVITVEDPVEYLLEGVNQVQVHTKAGLTFAKCLRSILRQDPNIIMVGEIRDGETAEIALKAAQTGHLVLSTVHTNDSIAAIIRLLDLGIPPFLIASSVTAIVSQRLVRKLCSCRAQAEVTPEFASRLLAGGIVNPDPTIYVATGCPACDHTGYKGRVGVFEMLVLNEATRVSIRSNARPDEIRVLARSGGMRVMQEDALEKARTGLTTLAELLRVVPFEQVCGTRCHECGREVVQTFLYCPYCGTKRRAQEAAEQSVPLPAPATPGGNFR